MPYLPMDSPSIITVEIADGFIPSVMFPQETFFLAHAYPSVRLSVFCWWVFFICDRLSDGNGSYRRLVYRTWSVGEAVSNYFTDGVHSCHRQKYSVGKTV
jgi:hypothetical protein